jgi:hypothetical protein
MNDFHDEPEYEALYEIPIQQLGLSAETAQLLKETGMTSVGNCVDFYHYFRFATVSVSSKVMEVMGKEVKEKLQEQGYWSYVESRRGRSLD